MIMKKNILLSLLVLATTAVFAQTSDSLSKTTMPAIGDTFWVATNQTPLLSVGTASPDSQHFDFTSLIPAELAYTISFDDADNSNRGVNYTDADEFATYLLFAQQGFSLTIENFFERLNDSSIVNLGFTLPTQFAAFFSNPEFRNVPPDTITYNGQKYGDTISSYGRVHFDQLDRNLADNADTIGMIENISTLVFDAFGSMTTPWGTYPNVIRAKLLSVANDTSYVIDAIGDTTSSFPSSALTQYQSNGTDTSYQYQYIVPSLANVAGVHLGNAIGGIVNVITDKSDFPTTVHFTQGALSQFSYSPPAQIKVGDTVTFTNQTIGNVDSFSWDFDDETIVSVEDTTHIFLTEGSFDVSLTAVNDFGTHVSTQTITTSGFNSVSEKEIRSEVSYYPNPTTEQLTVAIKSTNVTPKEVRVYNVNGQLVKTVTMNEMVKVINVQDLALGLHSFTIIGDNNITIAKGKFIRN
ncbi:MAG: PKD repeat protein [Sphingobacteriales bacterium]|jgi:PKD repeat protein